MKTIEDKTVTTSTVESKNGKYGEKDLLDLKGEYSYYILFGLNPPSKAK